MLVAPTPEEDLLLYIAAGPRAVSGVLVVEREEPDNREKIQRPVYYISEVLHGPKERYPQVQKLLYTVLTDEYVVYRVPHGGTKAGPYGVRAGPP